MNSNPAKCQMKGLMIAAPQSGSGKTVVTLALLRALKLAGVNVRGAKAGPDYIDPAFHGIAADAPSVNLDMWAMTGERCRELAIGQLHGREASHLLVEAMMGLFDGAADGSGSGAALAINLDIPVVLVVDAASQSHSIGALVSGFRDYDSRVQICGVILNKVGSLRHEAMLRQALEAIEMPVIGAVGRSAIFELHRRHLGLVQAGEISAIEEFITKAAEEIARGCDLAMLQECFGTLENSGAGTVTPVPPLGQHIAIARDAAFSFIYPHLLQDWRGLGAEISFFSPLANEGPSKNADAVYLPGGYPELHGAQIAGAGNFASLMQQARQRGALIYGECGGYMVLGNTLVDKDGKAHNMLGFLQLETSFARRKLHLGYRVMEAQGEFFAGKNIAGHEFHYSTIVSQQGEPLFKAVDALGVALGEQGLRRENVMGSYLHLIDVRSGDG